ncbi:MAG: YggS family pyridoxal phosphate-dependent enzyme [Caldiserica bacterium]|nr:YggS family pyridoxal phosphate-dependent enzyme [Caldisericota bacterium]
MSIRENIEEVKRRVEKALSRAGRTTEDIVILAATKTVEVERIREAVEAGIREIGENRVQEAQSKIESLEREGLRWHMIGRLQRNKVKYAVRLFDMIQSVDSLSLCEELEKRLSRAGKELEILVEVNIGGEPTKGGIIPEELGSFLGKIGGFPHIKCKGLMTIPPWFENPEKVRPYFARMYAIWEKVKEAGFPGVEMKYLSMGMSEDFEIAIEEGANMIRVGRAIFGERKR